MKGIIYIMLGAGGLMSCQTRQEQKKQEVIAADTIAQQRNDSIAKEALKIRLMARSDSLATIAKSRPIWGPRKKVIGDFNGDGQLDTLYEKYISLLNGKETNKDYDFSKSGEMAEQCCDWIAYKQTWIAQKKPLVRLESSNPAIQDFDIESGGAQNGIGYLKNVGDLNGDSTDEIAYYIQDVDFSTMNSCAMATYKNGVWMEVHHWDISEFDFGEGKPEPVYIRVKAGKVYCKEMADDWSGFVWKRLKTNW